MGLDRYAPLDAPPTVIISCRVFGSYAERLGRQELELKVPRGATLRAAVALLREQSAGGAEIPERPLVAVNRRHATLDDTLSDGDELALLPPLAGG